jgi:RimJ/RimL family protein N-acetyltransferase
MLCGKVVGLRARHPEDVPILEAAFLTDPVEGSRTTIRPWVPIAPGAANSPFANSEPTEQMVYFSVVRLLDDALVGSALLWGIDQHNRFAHLGLSLLPIFRGQGLARDTVDVLCRYGFVFRGLHRLQIDTLADNQPMIRTALSAGFVQEGRDRESWWVNGRFADGVVLGLLHNEWSGWPKPQQNH